MTGYVEVGSLLYAFTIDILAPNNQISEWQITQKSFTRNKDIIYSCLN